MFIRRRELEFLDLRITDLEDAIRMLRSELDKAKRDARKTQKMLVKANDILAVQMAKQGDMATKSRLNKVPVKDKSPRARSVKVKVKKSK